MSSTSDDANGALLHHLIDRVERDGESFESVCAAHPEMTARLRQALDDLARARELMPTADAMVIGPPDATTLDAAHRPERIGPYHILGLLGAGGMGEVYKAEQRHPVRRTVALKIVKLGFDSREVLARFSTERQALARMDHPNVARMIDAGMTDTGRPYFVMEYVPGKPLTEFCDDNRLSIRQRLELFSQACEAIAHAHTKAILHRDIKAANVLAYLQDGKPTVKVIDFGIAKALTADRLTDATFLTELGRAPGTYDSMSPEQAAGDFDIDTRTDVYSLGVLLYELLTGAKPFDRATLARAADEEIKRIIRDVEPPRPSTRISDMDANTRTRVAQLRRTRHESLCRDLRSELEWIPLKAMRKERDRRYASPSQLRTDIENYLNRRPLIGGPESGLYRLRKAVVRHSGTVLAGAAVVALFVVMTGMYVSKIRAEQRRTEAALLDARAQEVEANRQRTEAIRQEREAQQQASVARATSAFLSEMLASADPHKLLGDKVTVLQASQAAIKELDGGKLRDQPLVEAEIRDTICETLWSLGRYQDVVPVAVRTLQLRREMLPLDHPDVAKSMHYLGVVLSAVGRHHEAEPLLEGAVRIRRTAHPAGSVELAGSLGALAALRQSQDRLKEAQELYRESLELKRASPSADPIDVATSMNNLALALKAARTLDEAEPLLVSSLAIHREVLPGGHPLVAHALHNLGSLQHDRGRLDEAEQLYREGLAIRRQALPAGHCDLGTSLHDLARVLQAQGKRADAAETYEAALKVYREAFPNGHWYIGLSLSAYAGMLCDEGKYQQAEPMYSEAVELFQKQLPPGHAYTVATLKTLAALLALEGRFDMAEARSGELMNNLTLRFGRNAAPTTQAGEWAAKLFDLYGRAETAGRLRSEYGSAASSTLPSSTPP